MEKDEHIVHIFLEGLLIYFVAVKTIFTYSRFKPNNENPTPKYV